MSINSKILAARPQTETQLGLPDNDGLPGLTGSAKQVKWATTIRTETLKLKWSDANRILLSNIVDSSWWIANKTIASTLKFKNPAPAQMAKTHAAPLSDSTGYYEANGPTAYYEAYAKTVPENEWADPSTWDELRAALRDQAMVRYYSDGEWKLCNINVSDLDTLSAHEDLINYRFHIPTSSEVKVAGSPQPAEAPDSRSPSARITDAEKWAHSVSQNPKLAESAILAVMSKLYKEPKMKTALRARAEKMLETAVVDTEKDVEAIRKMLST